MAAWGLTRDESPQELVGIWPDNAASLNVFLAMGTQWRVGPGGAIGLDYQTLPFVLRMEGVPRAHHRTVFSDLREMEAQALLALHAD